MAVTYSLPIATGGVPPVQVSCTPTSGSPFAIGQTAVACQATDATAQSASCSFNVTVSVAPRLTRTKFLAFGDSFTAGEITLATGAEAGDRPNFSFAVVPATSYPSQLTTMLRTRYTLQSPTITVVNEGKPGEWAADGAMRLPTVMRAVNPEVLMILEGVNDLSALGQPGVSPALVAIDTMAKEGRNRGVRVFLATLPPTRAGVSPAIPNRLGALNTGIRSIAAGEGAVLVDLEVALRADVNRYIGADGLHPTEAGYQRIAETFFEAIRTALEAR